VAWVSIHGSSDGENGQQHTIPPVTNALPHPDSFVKLLASMIYRSYQPPPPLSFFVEGFWYYEGHTSGHPKDKLLPDGAMELIVDLTDVPKKLHESADPRRFTTFRNCWISGMQQGFLIIGSEPNSSMMGARFRPGGAFPFFGFPMSELSADVVELENIWKRDALLLREQLLAQPTPERKFAVLERFLFGLARERLALDRAVGFSLSRIAGTQGCTIGELADRSGLSQKSLIARFDKVVGLTPKFASRIFRFQRVLRNVGDRESVEWTQMALDCGYYDQAHFNHDFREFSGITPGEYLHSRGPFPNWLPLYS
jgi:AraC-like DNA-binding protein